MWPPRPRGLVHPIVAMIAMVLSVSLVLANGLAGDLVTGEGTIAAFTRDHVGPDGTAGRIE